jgi:predicted adenylyl cyclase CyaB
MNHILNVEIKAICKFPDKLFDKLQLLNANYKGEDHQIDTYFETPTGRLKLRQGNIENSLIYYDRKDTLEVKSSNIILERINEKTNLRDILKITNGIKVTVDKRRKILFIDNVKFHIDNVAGLGGFMEIEAIDTDRVRTEAQLKDQCDYYMKELQIMESDLLSVSYSDMLLGDFNANLQSQALTFLESTFKNIEATSLKLDSNFLDHLCYRVSNNVEYNVLFDQFSAVGKLLIASVIGGREISTFKLNMPIMFKNRSVDIIELPSVKPGTSYTSGFEHAEFVVNESFDDIIAKHTEISFDCASVNKKHNAELRLKFAPDISIKFHHLSLEKVIEQEILKKS